MTQSTPPACSVQSTLSARIWSKIDKDGPLPEYAPSLGRCWIWTGTKLKGYGALKICGSRLKAHRLAYEDAIGPIPDGLVLDHLCRVKACCRPSHVEPVTEQINILRGEGVAAHNAKKTHCLRGHELTPRPNKNGADWRTCISCGKASDKRSYLVKLAKQATMGVKVF